MGIRPPPLPTEHGRRILAVAELGRGLMFLRILLAACCLAAIVFSAQPAGAGELRVLGRDIESSSSRCIGDPKTARCAAETALACIAWYDRNLCRTVGYEDFGRRVWGYPWQESFSYEQSGARILTSGEAARLMELGLWGAVRIWREGDLAVRFQIFLCPPNERCRDNARCQSGLCSNAGPTANASDESLQSGFIVRNIGNSWQVIERIDPNDFPAEFWTRGAAKQ